MKHHNNFDFFRFLFALLVVISHSFPLSGIYEKEQWIYQFTNGQMVYSSIGLNGFFVISGFFIFQSMQRSQNLVQYFTKRLWRILPGLFVVLFLTLLLSPFVYEGKVPFLYNKEVWTYLPNNLSLYGFQATIDGVFDSNHYHAINGSLWTIRYEFSLYIAVACLFFLKGRKVITLLLLLLAFFSFYILYQFYLERFASAEIFGMLGYEILNLGTFFIAGSILACVKFEKYKYNFVFFGMAVLLFVGSIYYNYYSMVKHIVFPIIIIFSGYYTLPFLSTFGKYGDASYGIYIYSFPIQQALVYYFQLDTYSLIVYSCLLSVIFGYLSWHWVEKKCMSLSYTRTQYFFEKYKL
ncbi:acyltransferase family protein [Flavobacterium luminosum]|uniref:Acyltransferase n=1 Tax=Flavobacterium luminosum TaxID=2949086 RepID=A0ABT0TNM1_9FLAO|nr:acyltransferase [Flavobacterium sp. HXWNR70]MCL9809089.1 acyltransferase [Flavobacterium sp. HXWNR70]